MEESEEGYGKNGHNSLKEEQSFKAEGLKGVKCFLPIISESSVKISGTNHKMIVVHVKARGQDKDYKNITFKECEECAKCLPRSWIRRLAKMMYDITDAQYGAMSILYCMRKTYFQRTKPYFETLPMLLSREKGREWQNTRKREGGTWSEMEFHSQYFNKFKIPIYKVNGDGNFKWKEEDIIRYEDVDLVTFIDHFDPGEGIFVEGKKLKGIPNKDGNPYTYFEHLRQVGISLWFMKQRLKVRKTELIYHTKDEICRFDISRSAKNSKYFLEIEGWIYNRIVRLHNYIRAHVIPPAETNFLCSKCIFSSDCNEVERRKQL